MIKSEHAVLYVDDEAPNLKAFELAFDDRFRVLTAASGEEALRVLATEEVAVLLTDQRMPGMTGVELCAKVRERYPDVIRMVVSAYADFDAVTAAVNEGRVVRWISKPWNDAEVERALQSSLELYKLSTLSRSVQTRLLQQEPEVTVGFLLNQVIRDLSAPVGSLRNTISWLADTVSQLAELAAQGAPEAATLARELAPSMNEARLQANDLVRRLELYRQGQPEGRSSGHATVDQLVQIAVPMVENEIRKRARLSLDLSVKVEVVGEQARLVQAVVNMLTHACEAIDPGRVDDNRIGVATFARGAMAGIAVEDTGAPIAPEERARLFQFAEPRRHLGLALVRDTAERLGGSFRIDDGDGGRGSRLVFELPRAGELGRLGERARS